MAWRIEHNVVRGEIDNREHGIVRGRLWLHRVEEPVVLELSGNACPDIAGCVLHFENPEETYSTSTPLASMQRGKVGDLTASRKVRVIKLPYEEIKQLHAKGLPVPEEWSNSVYLEWFSEDNGRVVIESCDYKITISAPDWRLSPEAEDSRQREAQQNFDAFLGKYDQTIQQQAPRPAEEPWDEFDFEKLMRQSDARTDKYGELLDKYRDDPDRDRIVAHEMGWGWLEDAIDEAKEQAEAGEEPEVARAEDTLQELDDIPELEPNPATEGIDWVRCDDGYVAHPLCVRTREGALELSRKLRNMDPAMREDSDLIDLLNEYRVSGSKLAGALNSLAYDRLVEGAFVVAALKRGLGHLHAAQAALEKVSGKPLLDAQYLDQLRKELFAVREEILRLMEEFRKV